MAKQTVLIVEDERDIQELVQYNLQKEGYRVLTASSGEDGLRIAREQTPDLLVLDLMLPGIDGREVCRTLKQTPETDRIAVIMLTAKGEESDIVVGLELGADDYLTKPFSPKVLMARIRAVLRRVDKRQKTDPVAENDVLAIHDIVIHPGRREVTIGGEGVVLTATEFGLLQYLARRPGWVFSRQQILNAVRGDEVIVTDRAVDVQIVGLRKKMGDAGDYIETVRGVGYRFRE